MRYLLGAYFFYNMIEQLSTSVLSPHPDNRPLGINTEKVEQIAAIMTASGYDQSKPIKARRYGDGYQIIEGEHRWRAAKSAGIDTVPVFIIDVDDEEALIQLVAGNTQTDNHPLDVGRIVNKICVKDSKKGLSIAALATRWGIGESSLKRYSYGDNVKTKIEQSCTGARFITDYSILTEIHKCQQSDWLWFHDLILQKDLSKADAIEISKRIRAIDTASGEYSAQVFDLTTIKQECALAKEKQHNDWLSILEAVEDCAAKLPESEALYRYDINKGKVEQYDYEARSIFLGILKDAKQLTRADVFRHYTNRLDTIRQHTKEQAEKDLEYYQDEVNRQAAEERARAEWEAFVPKQGQWYALGNHWLYCGNNQDKAFLDKLPNAAFAFADPPYNAGVDEWDEGFVWNQDYLIEKAKIVAVTPGIGNIPGFFQATKMPYKWSLSTWIKNGMTRGALGFGNWMFTAIFSKESIHQNDQDFNAITIKTSDSAEHSHRGQKPPEYMDELIKKFTKEGDTVIDPFGGSGQTLFSCETTNRICFMAEIDPAYCKAIMNKYKKTKDDTLR